MLCVYVELIIAVEMALKSGIHPEPERPSPAQKCGGGWRARPCATALAGGLARRATTTA
jgi:hypothetical protein